VSSDSASWNLRFAEEVDREGLRMELRMEPETLEPGVSTEGMGENTAEEFELLDLMEIGVAMF
jgi:hypothetical protein